MVNEKDIKMAAHSIYFKNADKPKETVIARGEVGKDYSMSLEEFANALEKHRGKTIEIIIREVTDD